MRPGENRTGNPSRRDEAETHDEREARYEPIRSGAQARTMVATGFSIKSTETGKD